MDKGVYVPTIPYYLNLPCMRIALGGVCPPGSFMGSQAPSMVSQAGDRHVLAREWEYVDSTGAVVPLTLDEQATVTMKWKEGRVKTHRLIDHSWSGMWFQEENDREGGFMVQFSPDFSERSDNGSIAAWAPIEPLSLTRNV